MELQLFKNEKLGDIRTVVKEGETWFVAKDVCTILDIKDVSDTLAKRLDEDEKLIQKLSVSGQNRDTWTINESGLYTLVIRSNKPEAKQFRKWITGEVLPSIRKTGSYSINTPQTLKDALFLAYKQQEMIEKQEVLLLEQQPKVDYYNQILQSKGLLTITQIAKDYGMTGQSLNKVLKEEQIQFKKSGQWLLYRKYQDKGFTKSTTTSFTRSNGLEDFKMHTKWTQCGRLFIHSLMQKNEITALIDL